MKYSDSNQQVLCGREVIGKLPHTNTYSCISTVLSWTNCSKV
jgi:hypothetical protein